jgi:alkylation response protein AidB-like acyl-CoA dehydrogenase
MEARDYGLTEDQISLRRVCHRFVNGVVIPFVRENHEREWLAPPDERWPKELFLEAEKLGLRALGVPEKYGGMNIDTVTTAIIVEELGRGDPGFTNSLTNNRKVSAYLAQFAPEHLQDEWFPRYMNDPTFLMANCNTEPRGASDRALLYNAPEAGLQTRARFEDGCWVLNGRKQFISNGYLAKLYVVYANTDPSKGMLEGTSTFLVPRGTPGFKVEKANEKMGRRFCINGEMVFDNCRLPEDHLLVRDKAFKLRGGYGTAGKIAESAQAVGVAQAAFEATSAYTQEHFQGGKHILHHQMVAASLASMATRLETMRAFLYHVARAIDNGASDSGKLTLMLKVFCSETAVEICKDALEMHGGSGVMRELGVDKFFRDSIVALHTEGTTDIHRFKIINTMFPDTIGAYAAPFELESPE